MGGWLKLAASTLSLGPHQSQTVTFSVCIPSGLAGGQHLGGLVAAPLQPEATHVTHRGKAAFRVNIQEIAIVAVQINLTGRAQPQMNITSLGAAGRPGYQTLMIGLANTGNTLVKGRGDLTVSTAAGTPTVSRSFALDTFVPHTQIAFPVYVRGNRLPTGQYSGTVTITYGHEHTLRRTFPFTISNHQLRQTYGTTAPASLDGTRSGSSIPVWVLALGAAALTAASVGGSSVYFRKRALRASSPETL